MEAKAAKHSQKGLRGAARNLSWDKKPGPPKGKSTSSFGRSKIASIGGPRKGPFAMSATMQMSGKKSDGDFKAPGSPGVTLSTDPLFLSDSHGPPSVSVLVN